MSIKDEIACSSTATFIVGCVIFFPCLFLVVLPEKVIKDVCFKHDMNYFEGPCIQVYNCRCVGCSSRYCTESIKLNETGLCCRNTCCLSKDRYGDCNSYSTELCDLKWSQCVSVKSLISVGSSDNKQLPYEQYCYDDIECNNNLMNFYDDKSPFTCWRHRKTTDEFYPYEANESNDFIGGVIGCVCGGIIIALSVMVFICVKVDESFRNSRDNPKRKQLFPPIEMSDSIKQRNQLFPPIQILRNASNSPKKSEHCGTCVPNAPSLDQVIEEGKGNMQVNNNNSQVEGTF